MPLLLEPVPAPQAARLRRAVLNFRNGQHLRIFPTTVYVGDPDGEQACFAELSSADSSHRTRRSRDETVLDHAQRTDIVGVLLDQVERQLPAEPPMVWITRAGDVGQVHDIDAAWLAAARQAFAESGLPLTLIVITRSGWFDPRSGACRRWRRLR